MNRRDKIKSFEVVFQSSIQPVTTFLPVENYQRTSFKSVSGLTLPNMTTIKRNNMNDSDLCVLMRDWFMYFLYNGDNYSIAVKAGAIFDNASVPTVFVRRNLTKRGQHIQRAALVHDCLFALHLMPFEDANNVFAGIIEQTGLCNKLTQWAYTTAVRTPIGRKLYNENDPEKHWLRDYVEFRKI